MGKFYISTAIAYDPGKLHIGNTYEIVLADAIACGKGRNIQIIKSNLDNKDDMLGVYNVIEPTHIFACIDKEAKLKEIYENM